MRYFRVVTLGKRIVWLEVEGVVWREAPDRYSTTPKRFIIGIEVDRKGARVTRDGQFSRHVIQDIAIKRIAEYAMDPARAALKRVVKEKR